MVQSLNYGSLTIWRSVFMKISLQLSALAVAVSMFSTSAFASGIPTVDVANLTQNLTQYIEEFNQALKQYKTLENQYKEMQNTVNELKNVNNAIEGINKVGSLISIVDSVWDNEYRKIMDISNSDYFKTDASLDSNGMKFKEHYAKQCQYLINDDLKKNCNEQAVLKANVDNIPVKLYTNMQDLIQEGRQAYNKASSAHTAKDIADATAALNYVNQKFQTRFNEARMAREHFENLIRQEEAESEAAVAAWVQSDPENVKNVHFRF